jgi:hypothetical protein
MSFLSLEMRRPSLETAIPPLNLLNAFVTPICSKSKNRDNQNQYYYISAYFVRGMIRKFPEIIPSMFPGR